MGGKALFCQCPVQEGDHHGTRAVPVGIKTGFGDAVGDALLHRPEDGIEIEAVPGNVHEGILTLLAAVFAHGARENVTQGRDLLLRGQDLAADGTLLAVGQTRFRAGGGFAGEKLAGVAQRIGQLCNVAVAALAGVGGEAALGAGGRCDGGAVAVLSKKTVMSALVPAVGSVTSTCTRSVPTSGKDMGTAALCRPPLVWVGCSTGLGWDRA